VVTPLQPSVVYASPDPDALDAQYNDASGFTYAREGHPNASVLAQKIDGLEGMSGGIITGSGMSAIGAVFLGVLQAGDHVIGADQLYGRTLRLMADDLPKFGVQTSLADPTDAAAIAAARVHVFDWGRSELNTPPRHAALTPRGTAWSGEG
jgi:cystathionine gamma-synthase